MSAKFYTLLTDIGAAKLASAAALGVPLKITEMAAGDGGGLLPTPTVQQTTLVAEKHRAELNMLYIDPQNSSQIIAELVIPENVGGWWIREVGLFDETGALIAVGNCPESYKPLLAEGSGRTQTVRMVLITSSTESITLKIDPSVVLATRDYVDQAVSEEMAAHLAQDDPHAQYLKEEEADDKYLQISQNLAEIKAAGAAAVTQAKKNLAIPEDIAQAITSHKNDVDPHTQYLTQEEMQTYIPVGLPLPWPGATPPAGWLKCNGAVFSTALYPKLAQAYPTGKLPDLRGEFIRGWDDGRRIDEGRALLSAQQGTLLAFDGYSTGFAKSLPYPDIVNSRAPFDGDMFVGLVPDVHTSQINAERNGTGNVSGDYNAVRTRPRNVAFNYIVRAA